MGIWNDIPEETGVLLRKYDISHPFFERFMNIRECLESRCVDWNSFLEVGEGLFKTIRCMGSNFNTIFSTPPEDLTVEQLKRVLFLASNLRASAQEFSMYQFHRAQHNICIVLELSLSECSELRLQGKQLYVYALSSFHAFCYSVDIFKQILENNSSQFEVEVMMNELERTVDLS